MEKTITIFYMMIFIGLTSYSQAPDISWYGQMGGTLSEIGRDIVTDNAGNIYLTGSYSGTVDFDPSTGVSNLTAVGANDIFIVKMDSSGVLIWVKSIGGSNNDMCWGLTTDNNNNVLLTGQFVGTADFDPSTNNFNLTAQGADIFICKLSYDGDFVWAKKIGGISGDVGNSIICDSSNNVYVTGSFLSTVDFDPGGGTANITSYGATDCFVLRLDSLGNFVWANQFGGAQGDDGKCIKLDQNADLVFTGFFSSTADFDPSANTSSITSSGSLDGFTCKIDTAGNFIWANSFSGTSEINCWSLEIDQSGKIVVVGQMQGSVDFDPGIGNFNLTAVSGLDIFVVQLTSTGDFSWAKLLGGSGNNVAYSVSIDHQDNIYTTGAFQSTADFDPGVGTYSLTAQNNDVFISKLSNNGDFLWALQLGGANSDSGYGIIAGSNLEIYSTGFFWGTADFNPINGPGTLTSVAGVDIYVHKIVQCDPLLGTDVIESCGSHEWIDGITYTANNSNATWNLMNNYGCDSLVTLNLTILPLPDNSVSINGTTISANASGYQYQWLDCNDSNAPISGETGQSYTPTINGNYAVEISDGTCTVISNCEAVTTVSISEESFSLVVYPNPTTSFVTINLAQIESFSYQLLSLDGKLVASQIDVTTDQFEIDLSNQARGVYRLKVYSEDKSYTLKLIKQ
jgi:hypothetical protein